MYFAAVTTLLVKELIDTFSSTWMH